ncbi:MAG TPA: sensor histidine kinase N-terminal domain-containing protein [Candidatus Melainabacteria bacterium]|nr:sensor histidine kinase N-terminal domain-containing protein [Candidatus Melainabacteria bacterium]HMP49917.1 sensor histidine kinase N-terminal domain-containing protein [Candidatus Melainabacteria bacterium]
MIPLLALSFISTLSAYFLAINFANDAHDRQLLNTADSIAARLTSDGKSVRLDLPPAAQAIIRAIASPDVVRAARYKGHEKVLYQVLNQDGSRIAGDTVLPMPERSMFAKEPLFRTARLERKDLRIVRIRVHVPEYSGNAVIVQVAETLDNRNELANQIMASIVVPQVILIFLGSVAVSAGITRGLASLRILVSSLAQRSQLDLTPVAETNAPFEVRPLVQAINDLLARLHADIESQRRFVGNAAHQFRTPLAGIKTYVYAAKRITKDDRLIAILCQIDNGSDRMAHLANKLLALTKAESANQIEEFEPIDLISVVNEVVEDMSGEASAKQIDFHCRFGESKAVILGNSNNLYELAANLVENAISYTPVGGRVKVEIESGEQIVLRVSDNGRGIPDQERQRVFERFYRILGTDADGSGLGLSIVREIVEAHGASISILDGPDGGGTTVAVSFPAKIEKP